MKNEISNLETKNFKEEELERIREFLEPPLIVEIEPKGIIFTYYPLRGEEFKVQGRIRKVAGRYEISIEDFITFCNLSELKKEIINLILKVLEDRMKKISLEEKRDLLEIVINSLKETPLNQD